MIETLSARLVEPGELEEPQAEHLAVAKSLITALRKSNPKRGAVKAVPARA